MSEGIGTVTALWRYPVKSMRGETRDRLELEPRGVVGDRRFAVRTVDGKLGSGKNTRRFRRIEGLFRFSAELGDGEDDVPTVIFPDGARRRADDLAAHEALSAWVQQPVTLAREALSAWVQQPMTLAREAEVSHLDSAPVHLVTTASLRAFGAAVDGQVVDPRRFRPNLVVEVPGEGFVEQGWIGRELVVGEVRLRVIAPTERCVMIGFAQSELPEAPRLLVELGRLTEARLGVYAEVVRPGAVEVSAPVRFG